MKYNEKKKDFEKAKKLQKEKQKYFNQMQICLKKECEKDIKNLEALVKKMKSIK